MTSIANTVGTIRRATSADGSEVEFNTVSVTGVPDSSIRYQIKWHSGRGQFGGSYLFSSFESASKEYRSKVEQFI